MSTAPGRMPSYINTVASCLLDGAFRPLLETAPMSSKEAVFICHSTLDQLWESVVRNRAPITDRDFQQIQTLEKSILDPVKAMMTERGCDASEIKSLENTIETINQLMRHHTDLSGRKLITFLGEEWAQHCLTAGLVLSNLGALRGEHFYQMLNDATQEGNAGLKMQAYKSFLYSFSPHPRMNTFLQRYIQDPQFVGLLKDKAADEDFEKVPCRALLYLATTPLKNPEIESLIHGLFERPDCASLKGPLLETLKGSTEKCEELLSETTRQLKLGQAWAKSFFIEFFHREVNPSVQMRAFDEILKQCPLDSAIFEDFVSVLLLKPRYCARFEKWTQTQKVQGKIDATQADFCKQRASEAKLTRADTLKITNLGEEPSYDFAVERLLLQRKRRMKALLSGAAQLGDRGPPRQTECFPVVDTLLVGRPIDPQQEGGRILRSLQASLDGTGVRLTQIVSRHDPVRLAENLVDYCELEDGDIGTWIQDTMHIQGNQIGVPCMVAPEVTRAKFKALRAKRIQGKFRPEVLAQGYSLQGSALSQHLLDKMLRYTHAIGKLETHAKVHMTYIEGGNVLAGHYEDGEKVGQPFAIVGADTLSLNKYFLSAEGEEMGLLKRDGESLEAPEVSDDIILRAIAHDLGVPNGNVHVVEQPGDFHLDMVMQLLPGERVLLNDSRKSASRGFEVFSKLKGRNLNSRMAQSKISTHMQRAALMAEYEDHVAEELASQGFKVERIAGKITDHFERQPAMHRVNLFNSVTFRTPGEEGLNVVLALGSPPELKEEFVKTFSAHSSIEPDKFIFLDKKESQTLLRYNGGLRCITQKYMREE